jgi:hypothetical protein
MSEVFQRGVHGAPSSTFDPRRSGPGATGWVGWVVFGGLIMLLLGGFHVIAGFVAFFKDDYYRLGHQGLLVPMSWTAWGWVQIVFGVVLAVAGVGLLLGRIWGRVVTVIAALLSIVEDFVFLSAAPVWYIISITLAALTVYAVIMHGGEIRDVDYE